MVYYNHYFLLVLEMYSTIGIALYIALKGLQDFGMQLTDRQTQSIVTS